MRKRYNPKIEKFEDYLETDSEEELDEDEATDLGMDVPIYKSDDSDDDSDDMSTVAGRMRRLVKKEEEKEKKEKEEKEKEKKEKEEKEKKEEEKGTEKRKSEVSQTETDQNQIESEQHNTQTESDQSQTQTKKIKTYTNIVELPPNPRPPCSIVIGSAPKLPEDKIMAVILHYEGMGKGEALSKREIKELIRQKIADMKSEAVDEGLLKSAAVEAQMTIKEYKQMIAGYEEGSKA